MAEAPTGFGPVPLDPPLRNYEISDVETLRIVAEPVRLAILRLLMTDSEFHPPVMSAKEIAAALGEPQTKLYRHLKQLEEVGLIQVAETRLVSGIVEQRYRTAQMAIGMAPELVTNPEMQSESVALAAGVVTDFRDELVSNVRRRRLRLDPDDPDGGGVILQSGSVRLAPDRADEFHSRLAGLVREFMRSGEPEGVAVHMLVAWYAIDDSPGSRSGPG